MATFLLVTPHKAAFAGFEDALTKSHGIEVMRVETGGAALDLVSSAPIDLVVVDETLPDMSGIDFIRQLVAKNPMISSAAVSALSKADFHEASEGLGVLAHLPPHPGKAEAEDLVRQVAHLKSLFKSVAPSRQ